RFESYLATTRSQMELWLNIAYTYSATTVRCKPDVAKYNLLAGSDRRSRRASLRHDRSRLPLGFCMIVATARRRIHPSLSEEQRHVGLGHCRIPSDLEAPVR